MCLDKAALFWIKMGGTAELEYAGNFVPETNVLSAFFDSCVQRRGEHEEGSN
jgi:hypothetical protein